LKFKILSKTKRPTFYKMLVSYFLIFSLPLLIMGILAYNTTTTAIKKQLQQTYVNMVDDIIESVDKQFDSLNSFSVRLAQTPWVRKLMYSNIEDLSPENFDPNLVNDYIRDMITYRAINPFLTEISILFNSKNIILSTRGKYDIESFFNDAFYFSEMSYRDMVQLLNQQNTSITLYYRLKFCSLSFKIELC
jgi:DNA topoisomerase VI subunit B